MHFESSSTELNQIESSEKSIAFNQADDFNRTDHKGDLGSALM